MAAVPSRPGLATSIRLVPIGLVSPEDLKWACPALQRAFQVPVQVGPRAGLSKAGAPAASPATRDASKLMVALLGEASGAAVKTVAVTADELVAPGLSWVFGQAQVNGTVAVVSLRRLAESFYGRAPNPLLERKRMLTELGHETGHLFGLWHCASPRCWMHVSRAVEQIDAKGLGLCEACATRLAAGAKPAFAAG